MFLSFNVYFFVYPDTIGGQVPRRWKTRSQNKVFLPLLQDQLLKPPQSCVWGLENPWEQQGCSPGITAEGGKITESETLPHTLCKGKYLG